MENQGWLEPRYVHAALESWKFYEFLSSTYREILGPQGHVLVTMGAAQGLWYILNLDTCSGHPIALHSSQNTRIFVKNPNDGLLPHNRVVQDPQGSQVEQEREGNQGYLQSPHQQ